MSVCRLLRSHQQLQDIHHKDEPNSENKYPIRTAAETSELKSMWPGESTRLIKYGACLVVFSPVVSSVTMTSSSKKREMELDFMVIPRFCSSSLFYQFRNHHCVPIVHITNFTSEASGNNSIGANQTICKSTLDNEMNIPYVVFPWSTWARIQMFLT